jgi:phage gpG-like protein
MDVRMTDNSDEVRKMLNDAIDVAMEAIGIQCEGYAKLELENYPRRIDTGRLRNSISHMVQKQSAIIGTNVEYAPYVHEGTQRMVPNRFLKNAAEKHKDEYKAIIEMIMNRPI